MSKLFEFREAPVHSWGRRWDWWLEWGLARLERLRFWLEERAKQSPFTVVIETGIQVQIGSPHGKKPVCFDYYYCGWRGQKLREKAVQVGVILCKGTSQAELARRVLWVMLGHPELGARRYYYKELIQRRSHGLEDGI